MRTLTYTLFGLFVANMFFATFALANTCPAPDSREEANLILDEVPGFEANGTASNCFKSIVRRKMIETQSRDIGLVLDIMKQSAVGAIGGTGAGSDVDVD